MDEDPQEFDVLHQSWRNELQPSGPVEEELVFEIVQYYWRKRRVTRLVSDQFAWHADPELLDGTEPTDKFYAITKRSAPEKTKAYQMAERGEKLCELTAKQMAVEDRLDAMIDKALKRLAQIKAFKEVLSMQSANRPLALPAAA